MLMTLEAEGFTIEDADVFYLNFEGREGRYNAEGQRSFSVAVPVESVEELLEMGYNVRYTKPTDSEAAKPFLSVAVGYKIRPPRVIILSGDNRMRLDEENVGLLDWASIETVDLTCRRRHLPGGEGSKAYLQSMYVTLYHDRLRAKYDDDSI